MQIKIIVRLRRFGKWLIGTRYQWLWTRSMVSVFLFPFYRLHNTNLLFTPDLNAECLTATHIATDEACKNQQIHDERFTPLQVIRPACMADGQRTTEK